MTFLRVTGLSAGYGKSVVLRDVDLDVDEGEAVASGRMARVNQRFSCPSSARRRSAPAPSWSAAWSCGLPGYLAAKQGATLSPQGRMILPHLTVKENLLLGEACRRKGPWTLDKVYELFPVLRERRNASGMALSGGQQQMLAVGRALLGNPRVLLLDEPSEGLSPVLIDELTGVFARISASGVGILIVEQHLNLVRRITQRFLVMAKGQIIDRGRTEDIDSEQHRTALAF
jgi:branched-chain amino acid transport system ATP-binding protein